MWLTSSPANPKSKLFFPSKYVTFCSNFGKFQNNLSHIFNWLFPEGKDLFISACRRHCLVCSALNFSFIHLQLYLWENMVCFKKLYFHLKVFQKYRKKVSEKWNVRDKANFVKLSFFFFLFVLSCLSWGKV